MTTPLLFELEDIETSLSCSPAAAAEVELVAVAAELLLTLGRKRMSTSPFEEELEK